MLFTKDNQPVSKLSLGGAALGSCTEKVFFGRTISDKEAIETVLFALNNGINLVDTSPFYGDSERKIGLALQEYGNRNSFLLSTKAGTHPGIKGYSSDTILKSIENSLKLLQTDYLDIVHIHDPGNEDFENLMADGGGIDALLNLRYQGAIRKIGLGVRSHQLHQKFIDSGFANVILPYLDYNLISQSAENLIENAHLHKIDVLLGSPLCMGLLSGKNPKNLTISHFDISSEISINKAQKMYDWCQENNINLLALNLDFILSNPNITSVLIGPSNIEELKENISALNYTFDSVKKASFKEIFLSAVSTNI